MLKHFHLTKNQWLGILKWSLYGLLTLLTLLLQTVVLSRTTQLRIKPTPLPVLIVCVCVREGPERGGIYAIVTALLWCFSGADYGNLSVAILPVGAILFLPTALCAFGVCLLNASIIFVFKLILPPTVALDNYWRILLPGVALSMAFLPIQYPLVKCISRIGVRDAL